MIVGMFWNSGFSSLASITNIVTLSTTWKEEVDVCENDSEFRCEGIAVGFICSVSLADGATLLCPSVMLTRTSIESFFWEQGRNINIEVGSLMLQSESINLFLAALLISSGAHLKDEYVKTDIVFYCSINVSLCLQSPADTSSR